MSVKRIFTCFPSFRSNRLLYTSPSHKRWLIIHVILRTLGGGSIENGKFPFDRQSKHLSKSISPRKSKRKWDGREDDDIVPPELRDVETAADFLDYAVFRFKNPNIEPQSPTIRPLLSPHLYPHSAIPSISDSSPSFPSHYRSKKFDDMTSTPSLDERRNISAFRQKFKNFTKKCVTDKNTTQKNFIKNLEFGQMTLNAEEDALFLICEQIGISALNATKDTLKSRHLSTQEILSLDKIVSMRIEKKIPVAYIHEKAYFQGESFVVNRNVLIPRSFIGEVLINIRERHVEHLALTNKEIEFVDDSKKFPTEYLPVENLIDPTSIMRVLDLCCGCGCLAVIATRVFPYLQCVDAADISLPAIEVAKRNVKEKDLQHLIHLFSGDLFESLAGKKYDIILCKPPYSKIAEIKNLPAEYQKEPRIALEAGRDGLDLLERVLKEAANFLSIPTEVESTDSRRRDDLYEFDLQQDGGVLLLEIGGNCAALLRRYPQLREKAIWLDTTFSNNELLAISRRTLQQLHCKREIIDSNINDD